MSVVHAGATSLASLFILGLVATLGSRSLHVRLRWPLATSILLVAGTTLIAVLSAHRLSGARAIFLGAAVVNAVTDLQTGFIFDYVLVVSSAAIAVACRDAWTCEMTGALTGLGIASIPYALSWGRGVGIADIKYAGLIGLVLGPSGAVQAMYAAYVSAGVAGMCLLLRGRATRNSTIAFAPFMTFGAIWTLTVGS